jgi:hypothetical protein
MTRSAAVLASFALAAISARSADPLTVTPKPVAVHPAAAPKPALKYLLLPDLTEVHEGNQAHLFMKAFAEQSNFYFSKDEEDKRQKYLETPLNELPDDLRYYGGNLMKRLHDAACAEHCDWQVLRELKKDGAGTLLPDVQWMRRHAQVLKVRCRGEIKAGDFPAAVRTVQTLLALARSFNEHPSLIGQMVGCAIAAVGLGCVEEMIQQPGCPNLYWALSDLPAPFIDLNKGLKGDRVMFASEFADFPRGGEVWTGDQEARAFTRLPKLFGFLEPPPVKRPTDFAPYIVQMGNDVEFQTAAVGWLKEAGYADDDVKGMTPAQRVVVGSVERVTALNDDAAKWMRRPYHELPDEIKTLAAGKVGQLDVLQRGVFGGGMVAVMKPKLAQTRVDSLIAQLRQVEAVRMALAADGKFPLKLPADVATPLDPVSGKPFPYHVEDDGKTAVFTLTPPLGLETATPYNLRWRLTAAKGK